MKLERGLSSKSTNQRPGRNYLFEVHFSLISPHLLHQTHLSISSKRHLNGFFNLPPLQIDQLIKVISMSLLMNQVLSFHVMRFPVNPLYSGVLNQRHPGWPAFLTNILSCAQMDFFSVWIWIFFFQAHLTANTLCNLSLPGQNWMGFCFVFIYYLSSKDMRFLVSDRVAIDFLYPFALSIRMKLVNNMIVSCDNWLGGNVCGLWPPREVTPWISTHGHWW